MAKEPRVLEDVDIELEIGDRWFNETKPRHYSGKGYVRVMSEPVKWTEEGFGMQILNVEGRVASLDPKHPWAITSAKWNSLKAKTRMGQAENAQGRDLVERLYQESQVQERLERQAPSEAGGRSWGGANVTTGHAPPLAKVCRGKVPRPLSSRPNTLRSSVTRAAAQRGPRPGAPARSPADV
jgi:hypothetical protein